MTDLAPLPSGWRRLFWIEIPLVAGTLLLWLLAPERYLHDTLGIATPGPAEVLLLRLYAGSVGSLVLCFYAWWLAQRVVHRPAFRAFQVCLGLGDLAIVAASLLHWPHAVEHGMLAVQIGMALLWGGLRTGFVLAA